MTGTSVFLAWAVTSVKNGHGTVTAPVGIAAGAVAFHGGVGMVMESYNTSIEILSIGSSKFGVFNNVDFKEKKGPSGAFEYIATLVSDDQQLIANAANADIALNLITTLHTTYGMQLVANPNLQNIEKIITTLNSLKNIAKDIY